MFFVVAVALFGYFFTYIINEQEVKHLIFSTDEGKTGILFLCFILLIVPLFRVILGVFPSVSLYLAKLLTLKPSLNFLCLFRFSFFMTTMSDRVTLCLPTSNIQTRSVRSQSFNPPPTLGCHRSRRTLSLPAREKPIIPPAITESSECAPLVHDQYSVEMQRHLQGEGCDIGNVMLESMFPGAPNENIVQNHLNIALLNVF